MRADRALVERGLVSSRNQAQELIEAGRVFAIKSTGKVQIKKPSEDIPEEQQLEVAASHAPEFVSRGGTKLLGALKNLGLDVKGFTILDVGQSTGGFTDCLLQAGAAKVVGIDVGHGQLASKIKSDARVVSFEGINVRELAKADLMSHTAGQKFDLIVADVSFISLRLVLPEIIAYLNDSGRLLSLVKPQFEVGRENLGKNGIVKDEKLFDVVQTSITKLCKDLGLVVENYFASSIEGSDGNKEFFIYARKTSR
jgi:23S rRNA (cytidine1920-2'-O)/16S rRNA (cytidine1409-2'-O)-methyltransferase